MCEIDQTCITIVQHFFPLLDFTDSENKSKHGPGNNSFHHVASNMICALDLCIHQRVASNMLKDPWIYYHAAGNMMVHLQMNYHVASSMKASFK